MARATLGILLAGAIGLGCTAPGATVRPSADATPSPATTSDPTPAPTTEPPAHLVFDWPDGDQPVVTRALTGLDSESYINPGAVIEAADGTLHMYANVFTRWPGPMSVMHLTSADGADWELASAEPVLTNRDVPFTELGMDVSTGYVTDDGTWVLVFETVNLAAPWELGRATAGGPDGPWTVDPEPILSPGADGSIDAGGVAWPSVVETDSGYALYFTALEAARAPGGVIALATSPDGVSWTKASEPVLEATEAWEGAALDRPRVARVGDRFAMIYSGIPLTNRGLAWSDDGVTWERAGTEPVIMAEDFPITGNAWDAALVAQEGKLTYYLEIGSASSTTDIYRAVAE